MMLQEKLYPKWAVPVKRWWNRRYNRIILFWVVTSIASFIVVFVIATDYIQWDKLNRDFLHSNEVSRAFLAAFILVMDIFIVVQVKYETLVPILKCVKILYIIYNIQLIRSELFELFPCNCLHDH